MNNKLDQFTYDLQKDFYERIQRSGDTESMEYIRGHMSAIQTIRRYNQMHQFDSDKGSERIAIPGKWNTDSKNK